MNKYELEERDPVSSEFAFETFSKAGFKPISAICEIVDNSIEANASEIIIKFELRPLQTHQTSKRVEKFIFIDNGDGMNEKEIYDYFVATASNKRNKNDGIGKFGVGAYLSGISQAKVLEVYSKTKDGRWLYTNLHKGSKIPKPTSKDPPNNYSKYDKGTIVIWSDVYYKFTEQDIKEEENLIYELGRIYRKFITSKILKWVSDTKKNEIVDNKKIIKIKIDLGNEVLDVQPYDPLFLTYNPKTDDDEQPKFVSQNVPLRLDEHRGSMKITYSYLPQSWWIKAERPGNEPENKDMRKISERNNGISLIREGRELYFGSYPGGPIKIRNASKNEKGTKANIFSDTDRWLGIEISFNRDSDEIFGVEFNKTRIIMEKYVREKISKAISDTVVEFRNTFYSNRNENKEKTGSGKTKSAQGSTAKIQTGRPVKEPTTEEAKRIKEFAQKYKDDLEDIDIVYNDLLKGYHISFGYKLDPNGPFISFGYIGDSVLVKYNMEHKFMKRYYEALEEIGLKLGAEPEKANSKPEIQMLVNLIDILLASFGFSKNQYKDINDSQEIENTINQLMSYWSSSANKLAKTVLDSD